MPEVKCLITDIQRFCHNDGPGIRTTVFTKGCPLRCIWCHNPETYSGRQEIFYSEDRCIGCGACVKACGPKAHTFVNGKHIYRRDLCSLCGECVSVCAVKALEFCGKEMTPSEVLGEALKDKLFYESSGGGVTFSGGEPLIHSEFVSETARLLKEENINICIETSLFVSESALETVIPYVDTFLVDYKCLPCDYPKYTGGNFKKIFANITTLCEKALPVILRCPIIKGVNLSDDFFASVLDMTERFTNITEVDFEPYHPLGLAKSKRLGMSPKYENDFLGRDEVIYFTDRIKDRFKVPVIVK